MSWKLLALGGSAAVGALMAVQVKLGVAALVALCYVPLVMTNPGAGIAIWIALTSLQGISALNLGGKAAGVLIAAAWLGLLVHKRDAVAAVIRRNRVAFGAAAGLILWVTLSIAWASSPAATAKDLWHWYAVACAFVVIATGLESRRAVRLAVLGLIVGACLSVAYGLAGGQSGAEAIDPQSYAGRIGGAIGDPNFLAAVIVPALILAGVLMAARRELPARARTVAAFALVAALAVLIPGLVATQSRGGLVACIVGLAVAIPLFPGQRRWVVAGVLVLVAAGAVALALSPSALQRVSSVGNGSGRTDEWTVAWRIIRSHPIAGVGDANFEVVARNYTRLPGVLTEAQYLVDQPHLVHNTYLQFLSETGIVGLALFAAVTGACIRAGWLAAQRFRMIGDRAMVLLCRGVVIALIAMLTASLFISAGIDQTLWALLALPIALLALADREARAALLPFAPPVPEPYPRSMTYA